MTALPLFAPVLPPGTSPARATQGESASEGAGLFALLLAGMQPVQADVAPSADPARPPPAAPAPATQPQGLLTSGAVDAAAPSALPAAPHLAPTIPAAAQAGAAQGSLLPQLAPASPVAGPPVPAFAQNADRARAAPAPLPILADPTPGRAEAAGDTAAPLPPTVAPASRAAAPPFGPLQAASAPPAPPQAIPIALAGDAQVPPPPRRWSLETGAPRAATDMPRAHSRGSLSAAVGDRSIAPTGPEAGRPQALFLAPTSGASGPAAGQPAAEEQVWLEPSVDAPEGALARSEQAATEPARAPAPGRSTPPPPMFQIGVQIARAAPARIDRLFVQLEPASLGRVEVRLEFHRDNQVSAVIAAERPDTLDALQRDARVLERSLHQAGLRLDSDGLTFSLKREQAHDHPHDECRFAPAAGDLGDRPLLAAHGHEPAPVQWFRGLRALDIRV